MAIYRSVIEVFPAKLQQHQSAGAIVECWVEANEPDESLLMAKNFVRESGWTFQEIIQPPEAVRSRNESNAEYIDKVVRDGAYFVFHEWSDVVTH